MDDKAGNHSAFFLFLPRNPPHFEVFAVYHYWGHRHRPYLCVLQYNVSMISNILQICDYFLLCVPRVGRGFGYIGRFIELPSGEIIVLSKERA